MAFVQKMNGTKMASINCLLNILFQWKRDLFTILNELSNIWINILNHLPKKLLVKILIEINQKPGSVQNLEGKKKNAIPFIKFKIAAALVLSVGCKRGPITIAGLIVTMSIPFSFANFQTFSSANVFESIYHCWKTIQQDTQKH